MKISHRKSVSFSSFACLTAAVAMVGAADLMGAEPVVPGTGQKVVQVGDDFEDAAWSYTLNSPKSSRNIDNRDRTPAGVSKNGRWYEGMKRGHPDIVRRVETPAGGLPGSKSSLLLRSLRTGVPHSPSYEMQQDDFICNVNHRLGGMIPVWQTPSVVVRVFLPPVDTWEKRSGPQFGFRTEVDTRMKKAGKGLFSSAHMEREIYWPGFFIDFESKTVTGKENNYARLRIRADRAGQDFAGPQITQTGWWTFGISFTPDGQVHYYAKPGVEDLTQDDYITSRNPYSFRCERFRTFFFNVCNGDNGRTWSTDWVVDDPSLYYIPKK